METSKRIPKVGDWVRGVSWMSLHYSTIEFWLVVAVSSKYVTISSNVSNALLSYPVNGDWQFRDPLPISEEEQREDLAKEYLEARRRNKEALEALHNAGMKVLNGGGGVRIYLDTEIETKQWVVVKEPVRQWYGEEK